MTTSDHDKELRRILVADYLLKDKRFIPLYKEYVNKYVNYDTNDDIDLIAANIYVFTVNIEPSVIESHPEVVKEYIIYRLFVYACLKRIKDKLGDNITFIDPDVNKEAIVLKEDCHLGSNYLYLTATDPNTSGSYAQLQIKAIQLENLIPLTGVEPLNYPVSVHVWHSSGRNHNKPAEVKKIGEITKSQILAWFKE
ncbi:hypothetical protein [Intestinibacter sp.]|uniref:hypothetical protein n=1 Tax=Intestinibacter sp. TaxID=1965304 RepID=UPI002A74CA8B|nr:hypothetical protein [Intestinibacter sp.]MDY2736849.1 hypothetical protein [Intestinibacter sp.]